MRLYLQTRNRTVTATTLGLGCFARCRRDRYGKQASTEHTGFLSKYRS